MFPPCLLRLRAPFSTARLSCDFVPPGALGGGVYVCHSSPSLQERVLTQMLCLKLCLQGLLRRLPT